MRASDRGALIAAVALDSLLGDPPNRFHPVAAFGSLAGAVEGRLWSDSRIRGAALWAGLVFTATLVGAVADANPVTALALIEITVAGRGLREASEQVASALDRDDLAGARLALRSLVGRDTQDLDATEICRAAIESIADNTADAVLGPLVWASIAGAGGAVAFRAINTLDAMFGHRNNRYRRFGWLSARADDVAVWPASRLGILGAHLLVPPRRWSEMWRLLRVAKGHPSINAGAMEAVFAVLSSATLGGINRYGGHVVELPRLCAGPPPTTTSLRQASKMSARLTAIVVVGLEVLRWGR
ncbi:MAG: CobD/CbiB family cobalamin biosynthesis protein [Ferrimicrobium sp.]